MGGITDDVRFPPAAATRAPSTVIPRNLTPPASPPLEPRDFDVEAGKDRPAGSSVLPHTGGNAGDHEATTVSPGISRSNTFILHELNATTPSAVESEYDPLLLRTKLLGDEEIELRRRNTRQGKKVGKYVLPCPSRQEEVLTTPCLVIGFMMNRTNIFEIYSSLYRNTPMKLAMPKRAADCLYVIINDIWSLLT